MGGEPSKQKDGTVCTSAGQCSSNICAKPCLVSTSAWNRIKDVDNFNSRGFCGHSGQSKTALFCMSSTDYSSKILLKADGSVSYGSFAKGSKTKWNKDQCIRGVNCGSYEPTLTNEICGGSEWLKGVATSTDVGCEQQCSGADNCDTYCWSDKSPHWDCLMYKSCAQKSNRFQDGKSTSGYKCYKKQQVEEAVGWWGDEVEQAVGMAMVDAPAPGADMDTLAVDAFALIGLMCVLLMVFRTLTRFVTKPAPTTVNKTFTAVPTETTALEISYPEVL